MHTRVHIHPELNWSPHLYNALLLASSSNNSKLRGNKKLTKSALQSKFSPLVGITSDIQNVKKAFGPITKVLKSSTHQHQLLSKQKILNQIGELFNRYVQYSPFQSYTNYLLYSGHGHENGDWAVETSEKPEGDRITLDDILCLWKYKKGNALNLQIFMDSCFSGRWVQRIDFQDQVQIFTSSSPDQLSFCDQDGGLYFAFQFGDSNKQEQRLKKLLAHQQPCMVSCTRTRWPIQFSGYFVGVRQ